MIWARTSRQEERRVREFLLNERCCSETAHSLARKLGLNPKRCQRALEQMVDEGMLRRRDLGDVAPIYYRYGVD